MKHLLSVMLILCMISCKPEPVNIPLPPTVNTNAIFSLKCKQIVYSTNQSGSFKPYWIKLDLTNSTNLTDSIEGIYDDVFVSDISNDCSKISLVTDNDGTRFFDVLLYDFGDKELINITKSEYVDDSNPKFSPTKPLLAFLSFNRLVLYNYVLKKEVKVKDAILSFISLSWSPDGKYIYLEDANSSIWQYDIECSSFEMVWKSPVPSYSPKHISASKDYIFFISDHESLVSQAYSLHLPTRKLMRIYPSKFDQFSPIALENGRILLKTNIDGNIIILNIKDGVANPIYPTNGVIYDFLYHDGLQALLFSSDRHVTSIYGFNERGSLKNLILPNAKQRQPPAIKIRNSFGMTHIVYKPDEPVKGWIVWLHGGPHEQVSARFNPYFYALTQSGFAIIALNYPGSTGIGNKYELRYKPVKKHAEIQLRAIEEDLSQIKEQFSISQYAILGVSYGTVLGYPYAIKHSEEITHLIDFSGIAGIKSISSVNKALHHLPPLLVIAGEKDIISKNKSHMELLRSYSEGGSITSFDLEKEGHVINGRENTRKVVKAIIEFLNKN